MVFYKKKFNVSTYPITGSIGLDKNSDGTVDEQLPADAFVAFIRNRTNSRIGAITVTRNAEDKSVYSLNLRSEYIFEWENNVTLDYKYTDGKYYEYETTLKDLFANPNVVLKPAP